MPDPVKDWKREIRAWLARQPRAAVAGGAVALLLGGWFLYAPTCRSAQKARAQRLRLQAELADAYRTIQPARSGETPDLPSADAFHQVLEQLNGAARAHGVRLIEISPGTARTGGPTEPASVPVELQVEGEYRALGEFLGGLAQEPALGVVSVRQMSVERQEQILPRLKARVSLEILCSEVSHAP